MARTDLSTTAICPRNNSAPSTSVCWSTNPCAKTAKSKSVSIPTPARTAAVSIPLQELVDLIVDRTLKPLSEERLKAFEDKAAALKSSNRPRAERKAELQKLDPAEAVLNLKVLDPAMGSGHFLVTAVDFLSDYIAELIEYVPVVPDWLNGDYVSPLVKRVETIRSEIIRRAKESDWVPGRDPAHRSGHHPPHGAQTLHLRRSIKIRSPWNTPSVAMAAQLHRGRAAILP